LRAAPVKLDHRQTHLGELVLQRRSVPSLNGGAGGVALEVLLDEQFLMSSVVNQSEIALADLGLAPLRGDALDVLVGGLGLGHTAAAALANKAVQSLTVVECLADVIRWHRDGLVPLGEELCAEERCRFIEADFFANANPDGQGFDPEHPGRRFDAILVDIDHSTDILIHGSHRDFYRPQGLRGLLTFLRPGGVFALWSFEPPEPGFIQALEAVFPTHEVHEVPFHNPIADFDDANTVYVARAP